MKSVAVVGMACRLPGGLDSISELWSALSNKVVTADTVPADRWDAERYFSQDTGAAGKGYVKRGNFLKQDVKSFDATFFDLPPRVAENLDPQQRLMLEVVWEAFENAGLDLPAHAGRNIGVYVGGFMLDHMITQMGITNRNSINQNTAAGMMMTMLSNRISHAFDLHGPSLSIDTACSSSLTAFNYGFNDVRNGSAEMAVVGGVNIMTRPEYPVGMCKGQFLARDGECKSFDSRGDGYGRGEGAGVVILKDLEKAIQDGDEILASVLATGVNSDGRTPGISMPSGDAQRKLIEDVCEEYAIDPHTIDFVECHGTGTAVGDPTEANSVGSVYGAGRDLSADGTEPLVIGSIKSNIGHTEAAAGIAGVIKAVLTLQHREASPLGNFKEPNEAIPFDELNLQLPVKAIPLGGDGNPVRVAVNSFGYGGTNAHAIFEEAPLQAVASADTPERIDFPLMLPISARSRKALTAMAEKYAGLFANSTPDELDDILYSASHRRAHLEHRAVALGKDHKSLTQALNALAEGTEHECAVTGDVAFGARPEPVFVYTGMGPQWWGMGQELYRENAIFREALDEADAVFKAISGFSILEEMLKDEDTSEIIKTEYAQPGNFMVQLGLTKVLRAAGIEAGAIVGHSVGEVGSAWAAGALSLHDAMMVSYHRSRTQAKTAGSGSMLAVGLSVDSLMPYMEDFGDGIDIAAINGPNSLTVAGNTVAIHRLSEKLEAAEVFNRILQVEVPYHSHLMDPVLPELEEALADINPTAPTEKLFSTVTGEEVNGVAYDGPYWSRNVREPVSFMKAILALMEDGYSNFIEVGPHPVLRSALKECARSGGKEIRLAETLRRGEAEAPRIERAVAQIYANGGKIDWAMHNPVGNFVTLPNYPWQRERFWLETDRTAADRVYSTEHPLLGIANASAGLAWRNDVDLDMLGYLRDHVVGGAPVMPAAGYLETLFELGGLILDEDDTLEVRNASIAGPLVISKDRAIEYSTEYKPDTRIATIRSAEIGSIGAGQLHMSAEIGGISAPIVEVANLKELEKSFGQPDDVAAFYEDLHASGLMYGPAFQAVKQIHFRREHRDGLAYLELDDAQVEYKDRYVLHPSLLDGCFQMLMGLLDADDAMFLPTGFRSIRILTDAKTTKLWCHGKLVSRTAREIECDLTLYDESGRVIATVGGMRATAGANQTRTRTDKWGDPVKLITLGQNWNTAGILAEPTRMGKWLITKDTNEEIADQIIEGLDDLGAIPHRQVSFGDAYAAKGREVTLRVGNDDDAAKMLDEAGDLSGIVFAHGLDATADSDDPTAERAIEATIAILKSIAKLPIDQRPRVYFITRQAFSCDDNDGPVEPAQRAINGAVRVAFSELDGCQVTSVDLPERLTERVIEGLCLEVVADAPEDEIALRGRRRMMSEMAETEVLKTPIREERLITADAPVRARPAAASEETLVELVSIDSPELDDADVQLTIKAMSLPSSILTDPNKSTLEEPFVNVVAEVTSVGADVTDLAAGMTVYGYIPADFASHVTLPRKLLHVVSIPKETDPLIALDVLQEDVFAVYAVEVTGLAHGDTAIAHVGDPMAEAIATRLEAEGVTVMRIGNDDNPAMSSTLDRFLSEIPDGDKFSAIIAPMQSWLRDFGARCLAPGGLLVDTDDGALPMILPESVSSIVRTDISAVTGRRKRLAAALEAVANTLATHTKSGKSLNVSLGDLVTRQLEIPPIQIRIDVDFDIDRSPLPVAVERDLTFSPNASYMITGGLGGFGQKTASWLVDMGAKTLVLASRSGANSEDKKAFVAALEGQGVTVATPKCDLADRAAVADLIADISANLPPLKGVFHSAAVIEDSDLDKIDYDNYRLVMQSKATSADALDRATRDLDLDYFVLYSSVANSVGNKRQLPYSAANGFLDGLAWKRRSEGLPATSINWGAIGGAGVLVDDDATEQFLKYIGIRAIDVNEAISLMEATLVREVRQLGVMMISNWGDWARFETNGAQSPRFIDMIAADVNAGSGGDSEVREQLVGQLSELDAGERFEVLSGLIREVIAGELRAEPDSLSIDRPINELGVDSLMATEIQMMLETEIAVSITVMDMLSAATIRSVAERSLADFGFIEKIAAE